MKNSEIDAARAYHNETKHTYRSIAGGPHHLDWENQPIPLKIYTELAAIPLPTQLSSPKVPALEAITSRTIGGGGETIPSIATVSELMFLSAGVTRRRRYAGGEILFRAAACTGALYHIDLYLICGDLPGLSAGVYHFDPREFALRPIRVGDYREYVARASGGEPAIASAPCVVVSASTYWRNSWKYRSRAYRHCYWDSGTVLANLIAAAASRRLPATIVMGFVDHMITDLLGLDPAREAALSLTALGHGPAPLAGAPAVLDPVSLATEPLSRKEVDYPAIRAMHAASSLESEAQVRSWRRAAGGEIGSPGTEEHETLAAFLLRPLSSGQIPQDTLEDVIVRRGSTRVFSRQSISLAQLSTALERAAGPVEADFLSGDASVNDVYLIVNAVEDLPSGAYFYDRPRRRLQLLKEGSFRHDAGYLGLGQEIPRDASVCIYFLTDLETVLKRFGNRGYRAAQLEAAIMAGRLYLAAYAQRLGASGLTFFDDDVTDFFSPHAAGKSVMFLIALGKSAQRTA